MQWINDTGKKGGGIIGIAKTTSALCRWTFSFNLKSHIAELTNGMYSLYRGSTYLHNEATKSRPKRDNDDESLLLSSFLGFNVFSESVSHQGTLQNLVTKDLATEVIQVSQLRTTLLGQQEVKKFVQDRLIVAEQCDKPDVSIYEPVRKNNAPTFATLYQLGGSTHKWHRPGNCYEGRHKCPPTANYFLWGGRPVDLSSVLKHELLPVPVSLAEMNGTLRTGNKSELANLMTEDIDWPQTIKLSSSWKAWCFCDLRSSGRHLCEDSAGSRLCISHNWCCVRQGRNKQGYDQKAQRSKTTLQIRRLVEGSDVPLPKNWSIFL